MGARHLVNVARGVQPNRIAADGHRAVVTRRGTDAEVSKTHGTAVAGVDRERNVRRTRTLSQRHTLVQFTVEAIRLVEGAFPVVDDVEVTDQKRAAGGGIEALKFETEGHPLVAVIVLEREGHLWIIEQVVDRIGQADWRPPDGGHDARRVWHGTEIFAQTTDREREVEAFTGVGRGVNRVLIEHDVRSRDGRPVWEHETTPDRLRGEVERHGFAINPGVDIPDLGVVEHGLAAKCTKGGLVEGPIDVTVVGKVHTDVIGVVPEAKVEPNFRDPAIKEVVGRIEVEADQSLEAKHRTAKFVPLVHDDVLGEVLLCGGHLNVRSLRALSVDDGLDRHDRMVEIDAFDGGRESSVHQSRLIRVRTSHRVPCTTVNLWIGEVRLVEPGPNACSNVETVEHGRGQTVWAGVVVEHEIKRLVDVCVNVPQLDDVAA